VEECGSDDLVASVNERIRGWIENLSCFCNKRNFLSKSTLAFAGFAAVLSSFNTSFSNSLLISVTIAENQSKINAVLK
jgi:hypothetical protein